METSKKYAVIQNLSVNSTVWYCGIKYKDIKVINIEFKKALGTGLIADTLHTPKELYLDIKNHRYDFKGKLSKKYGVIDSRNNGSFSECFEAKRFRSIKKLLLENGYTIVDKRKPIKEEFNERDYKMNSYIFGI